MCLLIVLLLHKHVYNIYDFRFYSKGSESPIFLSNQSSFFIPLYYGASVLCALWPFVEKIEHKCSIYSFTQKSRVYFCTPNSIRSSFWKNKFFHKFSLMEPCVFHTLWPFVEIKIEHKCSICSFSSWSRVSALPRRPAAYKAAALLTELTRLTGLFYQK